MVQFLISLVEWFAIAALGWIGIDYDPNAGCAQPDTIELQPAVVRFVDQGGYAFAYERQVSDRCAGVAAFLPIESQPVLLLANQPIDS